MDREAPEEYCREVRGGTEEVETRATKTDSFASPVRRASPAPPEDVT